MISLNSLRKLWFNSEMEDLRYKIRLESFRRSRLLDDEIYRWPNSAPTMTSMARSFFKLSPTEDECDRVVCVKCGLELTGWSNYKDNPLKRHVGVNTHCLVSALGTIALNPIKFDPELLYIACLRSFECCEIDAKASQDYSRSGFYCMSQIEGQLETVGCLGCIPRGRGRHPLHGKDCTVWRIMQEFSKKPRESIPRLPSPERPCLKVDHAIVSPLYSQRLEMLECHQASSTQNCELILESSICIKAEQGKLDQPNVVQELQQELELEREQQQQQQQQEEQEQQQKQQELQQEQQQQQQELLQDQELQQEEQQQLNQDQLEQEKQDLNEKALDLILQQLISEEEQPSLSIEKCECIFNSASCELRSAILNCSTNLEKGRFSELEILELLEKLVIEVLEKVNARRISLICSEAERVVQKLIKEAGSSEISEHTE